LDFGVAEKQVDERGRERFSLALALEILFIIQTERENGSKYIYFSFSL